MNGLANRKKVIVIILLAGGIVVSSITYLFAKACVQCRPEGRFRIAMAGRSTMDHWFKYWNWPSLLHRFVIYRNIPIPHTRYVKDGIYFEYIPVDGPRFSDDDEENGKGMYTSIVRQVSGGKYDALFFKFCFVDFDDSRVTDDVTRGKKLGRMTALVEKVHTYARQQNMKVLLGMALPSTDSNAQGGKLRVEFNDWLKKFAAINNDDIVIDLFTPLVDENRKLRPEFARGKSDSHVNGNGFETLDRELFQKLNVLGKRKK